jgi:peroxiredoxin Q/BCP
VLLFRKEFDMLSVGDKVALFELNDQHGQLRTSRELASTGWMLLYFYPADFTPLCTAQACMGRDRHAELAAAGVTLVGISRQSEDSKRKFAAENKLPFVLLADPDGIVLKQFGVLALGGLVTRRVSYLLQSAADGSLTVVDRHESNFTLSGHSAFVERVLHRVQKTITQAG